MKDVQIESGWKEVLKEEFAKPYFSNLREWVREQYKTSTVYPPAKLIFNAFDSCPFANVKVVILGQDPYHGPGQAHGLCFSVNEGVPFPPSLQNIFKEIADDLQKPIPKSGNLTHWANQGVLLLNATLTVQKDKAGSHQNKGWEEFTDAAIKILAEKKSNLVFLLWGSFAQKKEVLIPPNKHLVLKSAHPSPLSAYRGFLGNKHFSKTNEYLLTQGKKPIDW
ncbi:uracil-DNA glycosylase [Leptospira sp. 2 VSF19]|uniref:Uracil-DNA glycosylase n=1 Tax=Leptospira soteropolitanensis TaxID=2950025 RepID=A0AAW5VQA0_9LEPT|nr:uracil-DNA glycosylase [Leptospira soteropolitanensis]MCW7494207.1 uracil-DNA glycosylase [Leptospira soteropolitanensis]MCW7501818.1 uracil-DNA glycosylase [Leptospira soteropolitanensis]MCW7524053.1 uracil-DNA glycosylase [Leptospira soteropolitanensis]MCW7527918.1 uracil-DNA glycosylase [Leptospira soteropolitanensis]MCW7531788.1 uracil-DNA glycosylase [Leptospira soteropolitanensis]